MKVFFVPTLVQTPGMFWKNTVLKNFFQSYLTSFYFNFINFRNGSRRRCSVRKGIHRNFTKFTGKHLCHSLFLNKVSGLRPATLLKKKLWHSYFPVNFMKFLRTPFLQNTSGRLLLELLFSVNERQKLQQSS